MFSREVTEHGYVTYPRRFEGYKWSKPIIVTVLFLAFYYIFMNVIVLFSAVCSGNLTEMIKNLKSGYDAFDTFSAFGALATLGSIAAAIPALMLAAAIFKDRPFSSYTSSRGGWNWKIFFIMLVPALIIIGIPGVILTLRENGNHVVRFTVVGFIMVTILGPLQCVAEEYIFRGLIMQTVGSWFRLPIIGIIVQVIVFAVLHPYNMWGVLSVSVTGLCFGIIAYLTKGLETSSAVHIVNNMIAFYMTGFGLGKIETNVNPTDLIFNAIALPIYIVVIIIIEKKFHLFDEVKKDDVAIFNEKKQQSQKA